MISDGINHSWIGSRRLIGAALAGCIALAGGCSNAKQGALSGAGIGALSGLAIGSLSGNAGEGAAIGAIVGGVGGAIIGDQNRRREEAAQQQGQQPPPSSPGMQPVQTTATVVEYRTGGPLAGLLGKWNVVGEMNDSGRPVAFTGTAVGAVDKTYFVRIDMTIQDPRNGSTVQGTSIISQHGGTKIQMANTSSSSPTVRRFAGDMDASGSFFNLTEIDNSPGVQPRRLIIRFMPDGHWTCDVWSGDQKLETYNFWPNRS